MQRRHHLKQLERRQRSRSSEAEEDETTPVPRSTTRRVRPTASSEEEEVETTARSRPAATSRTLPTSRPVASSPAISSSTPIPSNPVVAPRPSSLSSASSSQNNAADDAANRSANSSGSSTNTGLIVGVVVAVLGALALGAVLFFFIRKRRANQQQHHSGNQREKPDDEQSFIGAGGLATSQGEKYGMSDIGHQSANGQPWGNSSDLSYVHTPSASNHGSAESHMMGGPVNLNMPAYGEPQHGFAPPQAAMMSHPADRLSVANPYTAAQPNVQAMMPAIAEDSPFEDPQWANKVFQVTRTFQPSMPDELIIMPGNRVRILMAYDDGWCLGENLDSVPENSPHQPARGVFPRDCVEEIGLAQQPISSAPSMPAIQEAANYESPALPDPFTQPLVVTNGLPAGASPAAEFRPESPQKGANLQRAPTLPPLDVGARASQTFFGTSHLSSAEGAAGIPAEAPESKPSHLSTSSSLHNSSDIIDGFPGVPNKAAAPASGPGSGTHTPVKRSSSLIAGKDKELFAALELGDHEDADADQLK